MIALDGWLSGAGGPALDRPLTAALGDGHPHVVLDLHMLRGLDHDGLTVLWVALRGVTRRGGTLAAAGLAPSLLPALNPFVPHGLRLHRTLRAALAEGPDPRALS